MTDEEPPPYECIFCDEGLVLMATMAVRDGQVMSVMAPRTCKACKGVGRVWFPSGTPPV